MENYIARLEALMQFFEEKRGIAWGIKFEIADQCCWSAELRITEKPNNAGSLNVAGVIPDISEVYYLAGLETPEAGARVFCEMFRDGWVETKKRMTRKGKN